ncbi:MAG: 16S rRNA (guanine(966)-N(2))-methyltransferase RsmD [Balneolaceae bacterium]
MRIITGKLKGRIIDVPDTGELRPTSDRAKEGIFSAIAARRYFDGLTVLDLFAGSGNLGFEALSRGAKQVLFVDMNPRHIEHIRHTAEQLDVAAQCVTRTAEVMELLNGPVLPADLIFADPPYDYPAMDEIMDTVLEQEWLTADGLLILEHDKRHDFSAHAHAVYTKAYGRTIATIFAAKPDQF